MIALKHRRGHDLLPVVRLAAAPPPSSARSSAPFAPAAEQARASCRCTWPPPSPCSARSSTWSSFGPHVHQRGRRVLQLGARGRSRGGRILRCWLAGLIAGVGLLPKQTSCDRAGRGAVGAGLPAGHLDRAQPRPAASTIDWAPVPGHRVQRAAGDRRRRGAAARRRCHHRARAAAQVRAARSTASTARPRGTTVSPAPGPQPQQGPASRGPGGYPRAVRWLPQQRRRPVDSVPAAARSTAARRPRPPDSQRTASRRRAARDRRRCRSQPSAPTQHRSSRLSRRRNRSASVVVRCARAARRARSTVT